MISIIKGEEPRKLREYRNDHEVRCFVGDVWEFGPVLSNGLTLSEVKQEIRASLFREQHGLCAYCMAPISPDRSKIEHFIPRRVEPGRALDYNNLLLCCQGICQDKKTTCDTHKKDALPIQLHNPADRERNIEAFVSYDYRDSSLLWQGNNDPDDEINRLLNLNLSWLKKNRADAWKFFYKNLVQKYRNRAHVNVVKELQNLRSSTISRWSPFVGYLEYRLRRLCGANK